MLSRTKARPKVRISRLSRTTIGTVSLRPLTTNGRLGCVIAVRLMRWSARTPSAICFVVRYSWNARDARCAICVAPWDDVSSPLMATMGSGLEVFGSWTAFAV